MSAPAKSRKPSYEVEVYGPADGFYSGTVMADGQPIGAVWSCTSQAEVQEQAVSAVRRHQAGAATFKLNVPEAAGK
jgi:hypothetical protein